MTDEPPKIDLSKPGSDVAAALSEIGNLARSEGVAIGNSEPFAYGVMRLHFRIKALEASVERLERLAFGKGA